jgi:hypothetical protein
VIAESQVFARYQVRHIDSTRSRASALAPAAEAGGKKVGVEVAGEQQHLKEEHAGGPHRGRAAEPRQKEFSEDQLGPKEQESAKKNRKGKLDARKRKPRLCGRAHRWPL